MRIAYKDTNPVTPQAASNFDWGRNLNELIITLYVAARVLTAVNQRRPCENATSHSLESALAKKTCHLARDDVDGGTSHETTDSWQWNELDYPSEAKEADA